MWSLLHSRYDSAQGHFTRDATITQLRIVISETTRGDCEGMLKVMDGMEKQIAEYATREEQTLALARESRESVEQANLERDQGVAREAQARREIARLLEEKRTGAAEAEARQNVAINAIRESMGQRLIARDTDVTALISEVSGQSENAQRPCTRVCNSLTTNHIAATCNRTEA